MRARLRALDTRWRITWGLLIVLLILGLIAWIVVHDREQQIRAIETVVISNQSIAEENKRLIESVDKLNREQAEAAYKECIDRNQRTEVANRELVKLVGAHKQDGNRQVSKFWESYLKKLRAVKLPKCKKPSDEES